MLLLLLPRLIAIVTLSQGNQSLGGIVLSGGKVVLLPEFIRLELIAYLDDLPDQRVFLLHKKSL